MNRVVLSCFYLTVGIHDMGFPGLHILLQRHLGVVVGHKPHFVHLCSHFIIILDMTARTLNRGNLNLEYSRTKKGVFLNFNELTNQITGP